MTTTDSISCDLDFERDGKYFGSLDLVYSDNKHAFAKIPIPVVSIKNGSGATILLTAGNHGDEYEGQVILRRIIHQLEATSIHGRLIILPALNYPAVLENTRVSPLDQGNLNRSFPGQAGGPPTSAIAHFVTTRLLPLADAGIDLHSGGSRAYYLPSAFLCSCEDPAIMQQSLALAEAFNAPYTLVVRGEESSSGFDPVAQNLGIPFISTELCGGANVDIGATEIGLTGVYNIMHQLGILTAQRSWQARTRFLNGIDGLHYLSAPYSGIFEPFHQLGDIVNQGDSAGLLYSLEEVERAPLELKFKNSGVVLVRRNGTRVRRGSHLFMVAGELERNDMQQYLNISIS